MSYQSTKTIELGSCAFRQWRATHSHCSKIHGYQLKAKLWFGGSSLDEKNWIVDFGGLKELKAKLQSIFDHTFTVAADDPELELFKTLADRGVVNLQIFENGVGIERAAEAVFKIANEYITGITNGRCWVNQVEVFEHEDNTAIYSKCSQALNTSDTTAAPINEQPTPVQPTQESAPRVGNPAPVGNTPTQGMGNLFAGTSWG